MHNSYLIINLFYTIKSSVHTLRNFIILTQFSRILWFLISCLQPTLYPSCSSIPALVFLIRILVIGCPMYLGVLGLYSSRWFDVFPSLLKKQNLHFPPPISFKFPTVNEKEMNGVFLSAYYLQVKYFSPIRQFYHNWHHSTYDSTWWWTHVQWLIIYHNCLLLSFKKKTKLVASALGFSSMIGHWLS